MIQRIAVGFGAVFAVLGLVALVIAGFIVLPVPAGEVVLEAYRQMMPTDNPVLFWSGFWAFALVKLWPVALVFALALLAAWLWLMRSKDEETTAYLEHAHGLEVALRQAREQADFATSAWEALNIKLDELFSHTSEMLLVVHPISGIRRANMATVALAKRINPGLANLEGLPLDQIANAAPLLEAVQRAATEQRVWQGEFHLSGLDQWMLAWVLPFGNEVMIILRDVTGMHRSQGFQQSAELVLRQVIEESVRPVALVDTEWRYMYHSFKWPELLGLAGRGSLIGQEHWAVCPYFPANKGVVLQQLASGQILGLHEERAMINGQEHILSWFVRPWRDAGGRLGGYIFGVQDMTEYQRLKQQVSVAEERENQLAYADTLTGLPNRQLFNDRLSVALSQAYRNLGKLAVLFLDLDGFKGVNDRLGHASGDLLLKQVAERLKTCVRTSDTLARLGGDEFTMILHIRDVADAEVVAQKVLQVIHEPYNLNGQMVDTVGTSIGIALYPQHGVQAADLIKAADNAMYAAKEGGKNTYRFAPAPAAAPGK